MRIYPGILLAFVYVASVAAYGTDMVVPAPGSLIQAQSFPKTFADVSFVDRMEVLSEGYDDVASEYDENGVCISGCAYVGITLEKEEELIERAANELEELVKKEMERRAALEEQEKAWQSAQQQTQSNQQTVQQGTGTQTQQAQQQTAQQAQQQITQQAQTGQKTQKKTTAQKTQSGKTQSADEYKQQFAQQLQTQYSSGEGGQTFFGPPVKGNVKVGSDFGERRPPKTKNGKGSRWHRGLDIKATTGTPLYAAADGKVTFAGKSGGYGNKVQIQHAFSTSSKTASTVYAHMSRINVKSGQQVKKGDLIGAAGNTGNSGGPHLHYELLFGDIKVDPLGAKVKPIVDVGADVAASTSGTNYLGAPYCIKPGISSTRLKKFQGNDAAIRENFPQSTGWCKTY